MPLESAKEGSTKFLDSALYKAPQNFLHQSVRALNLPHNIQTQWDNYLGPFLGEGENNQKDPLHQERMKAILDGLLEAGMKEEAGLIFNIHRTLTGFRGYDANYKTSSDVAACFNDEMSIPKEGVIVVDHFVTGNLAAIVKYCKSHDIDLGRIRVRVPQGAWAVQAMGLSGDKKKEFEEACAELNEDQFLIKDVTHVQDIKLREKVAVMLSPRTAPIYPRLHAETESKTVNNYRKWIRQQINQLVPEGRMLLNIAKVKDFAPLSTELSEEGLAKLTNTVSDRVAKAVLQETTSQGITILQNGTFTPPNYDHTKECVRYHAKKPKSWKDRTKNRLKYWGKWVKRLFRKE